MTFVGVRTRQSIRFIFSNRRDKLGKFYVCYDACLLLSIKCVFAIWHCLESFKSVNTKVQLPIIYFSVSPFCLALCDTPNQFVSIHRFNITPFGRYNIVGVLVVDSDILKVAGTFMSLWVFTVL